MDIGAVRMSKELTDRRWVGELDKKTGRRVRIKDKQHRGCKNSLLWGDDDETQKENEIIKWG